MTHAPVSAPQPSLRIVVMGTGPFAVPMFRAILESSHPVVAVVTRPAHAPAGRRPPPNPMRDAAARAGVPILDPERINDPESIAAVRGLSPDLLVVCDYGQILSPAALAVAPYGGINLHGSLLPRHRGAAPVQWAILAGDATTGASVIHMTPALDAGNVIVAKETPINAAETAPQLEQRLAGMGVAAVLEAIYISKAHDITTAQRVFVQVRPEQAGEDHADTRHDDEAEDVAGRLATALADRKSICYVCRWGGDYSLPERFT
jgi:methionyl-tRNA formyltransferase